MSVLDAFTGDVEIFRFALNADESAPHLNSSNASCAATHEGVEDGV